MSIGIVILAAGESTRMGTPKQLLTFRGRSLLRGVVDTALSLPGAPVAVVLGAHAGEIRPDLEDTPVIAVENPTWREGMGSSLRMGLRALLEAHETISAVLFLLCDQPLISGSLLGFLIAAHERTDCPVVASAYGDRLGVPALFARPFFPELLALEGDRGARQIIEAHRDQVLSVPFPEGAFDIDTPIDYARLRVSFSDLQTPTPV